MDTEPMIKQESAKDFKTLNLYLVIFLAVSITTNILLSINNFKQVKSPQQEEAIEVSEIPLEEPESISTTQPSAEEVVSTTHLNLERLLLTQKTEDTQALSKLYGFKFNSFHNEWECNNQAMQYTPEGVVVTCTQKPCSLVQGRFPDNVSEEKSDACSEELANREFSSSQLSRLNINVDEFVSDEEPVFNTNAMTPKGRAYNLEVTDENKYETGYIKKLKVTFYSPKELTSLLSNLSGTFYGADYVYAKYLLEVGIYDNPYEDAQIIEDKVTRLIESLIDSIEFTDPIEL